jgi:hypothetical protein
MLAEDPPELDPDIPAGAPDELPLRRSCLRINRDDSTTLLLAQQENEPNVFTHKRQGAAESTDL